MNSCAPATKHDGANVTEVLFYHLTESKLDDALPMLVEKSMERGWRVAVEFTDPERRDEFDVHLWTYRDDSFLPHGTDDGEEPERQRQHDDAAQPVVRFARRFRSGAPGWRRSRVARGAADLGRHLVSPRRHRTSRAPRRCAATPPPPAARSPVILQA